MSKTIALVSLGSAQFGLSLANYWFTFGIWPRSWWSFALCFVGTVTIQVFYEAIKQEK